jgi:hypothetical protein
VAITVNIPDFSVTSSPSVLPIIAGQTGMATLIVTPVTSLTSPVSLACGTGYVIPGATCQIAPQTVTLTNGMAANATLSLATLPPSGSPSTQAVSAQMISTTRIGFDTHGWWTLGAFAALGTLVLLALPGHQRRRQLVLSSVWLCLLSFALGCGGGGNSASIGAGGGGFGGGGAPVPTTVTLTASTTKLPQGANLVLTAMVNSTKPVTGTVTFLDASFPGVIAPNVNLTNGTAQVQANSLNPGTHVLSVQYSGDANNQQSQSGSLNVVITGSTMQRVVAQTSVDEHVIYVNITIQ